VWATNISTFTGATVIDLTCGTPTVNLDLIVLDFYFMKLGCEYKFEVDGAVAVDGEAGWTLFEEDFVPLFGPFGFGGPELVTGRVIDTPPPNQFDIITSFYLFRCDDEDLTVEIDPQGLTGFLDLDETAVELFVEDGSARAPGGVWHFVCDERSSQVVMGGTVNEVFDDGFLDGAVSVGDPWAVEFEFAPGETLFNDGTTSSFRVSNIEFAFGSGDDFVKYSNLPPSALFDDALTTFNDFGDTPFDEMLTQDFTMQQESGPPLPTEFTIFQTDMFDADGAVFGPPISSFSDVLDALSDPNFLANLEATEVMFEAVEEIPDFESEELGAEKFVPHQTFQGTTILGSIQSIIVTKPQQVVGGEIIPIETTSLLLAGAQSTTWLIPVVLSIVGIGLVLVRRKI